MMIKKTVISETGWNLENSYAELPESFFSRIQLKPVPSPKLIIVNESLAKSIGLNIQCLKNDDNISVFAGNRIPDNSVPIAQAYAGHQFGHFTLLGDGRASLIGEQITPLGERVDIQLKGSGKTPYSRGGDGRAVLGPMLREYIVSEAMYSMGIPTTRSLAVVTTGESIVREGEQTGAILTRIAASHIRVGTFQYASNWCTDDEFKIFVDYVIKRHFSYINNNENPYLVLLKEVIKRQASLIAKWQLVGFIHGVMNTDNMTISGETIDYGPCAFMDTYNPATVFSSIDTYGRYSYENQPNIASWNLARFAETLLPLLHESRDKAIELAQDEIINFMKLYNNNWLTGMRKKLGIFNEESQDESLVKELLNMMHKYKSDYTNTFRALTFSKNEDADLFRSLEFTQWYELWQSRLSRQQETKEASQQLMKSSNPALIPRNHRVEAALEAAVKQEDYSVMNNLLNALSNPYAHSKEQEEYATVPKLSTCPYRTFCGT